MKKATTGRYSELLSLPEWRAKRDKIKARDAYTCQSCGRSMDDHSMLTASDFDVHHMYYRKGWMPWDYPDAHLITLCSRCHRVRHESSQEMNMLIQTLSLHQFYLLTDMLRNEHDTVQPSNFWRKNTERSNEVKTIQELIAENKKRPYRGISFCFGVKHGK